MVVGVKDSHSDSARFIEESTSAIRESEVSFPFKERWVFDIIIFNHLRQTISGSSKGQLAIAREDTTSFRSSATTSTERELTSSNLFLCISIAIQAISL